MLLRTFKNLLHDQFHSGYLDRNLHSRNRIITLMNLLQIFIPLIQNLLHLRRHILSAPLHLFLPQLLFLLLFLQSLLRLRILLISLITCDQAGFLSIHMPLTKPPTVDHLPYILLYKLHRLINCLRKLLQIAVSMRT